MIAFSPYIDITKLYTYYSFDFAKDYVFKGESHNFWELAYVDKGILEVMAGTNHLELKQGQMIFHKPNEFHALWGNGEIAPNVIVFSFKCESPAMDFFKDKVMDLNKEQQYLLKTCIEEAETSLYEQTLKEGCPPGSGQMLKISLEHFLIALIRDHHVATLKTSPQIKKRMENNVATQIADYLQNHIWDNLCLQDLVEHYHLSSSYIKVIFKTHYNVSIMRYFRNKRIEKAKELIRDTSYTFTEIADRMNYSSIHSFSKQFKEVSGMTPTEYSKSMAVF